MIDDKANVERLILATQEDIRRITRANGFLTEVNDVLMPDWEPSDTQSCLKPEAQAVMLWPDLSPMETENSSELRPSLTLIVVQSFKEPRGLATSMLRGMEDLRTVMYSNPARDWPGSTEPNTWGLFTKQTPGQPFVFRNYGAIGTLYVGLLWSSWTLSYRRGVGTA